MNNINSQNLNSLWHRIKTWYESHVPEVVEEFQPPATDQQFDELENLTGLALPDEIKQSYHIHNGSWALRMFPEGNLMSLAQSGYEWGRWRDVLESGELSETGIDPEGPVRTVPWNLRWLPLTTNGGGDHFCLDLDPSAEGTVGQIIWFSHEQGPVQVVANGMTEWLSNYVTNLEAGRYRFQPPYEMVIA